MSRELPKTYDPKENEDRIYRLWEKSGYFNPDKLKTKKIPMILLCQFMGIIFL